MVGGEADKENMTKRLKFITGTIIGVMVGLIIGWLLSILLIAPLALFLLSDLPYPWTNIQEKIAIGVGITSWALIVLSGVVGGGLGWRVAKKFKISAKGGSASGGKS